MRMRTLARSRGSVWQDGARALRVEAEFMHTAINVHDNGPAASSMRMRDRQARLAAELSNRHTLASGGIVESALELGSRSDSSDGKRVEGTELGSRVRYVKNSITAESEARVLLGHSTDQWGVHSLVRLDPGVHGRGLSFSAQPGYGFVASNFKRVWEESPNTENAQRGHTALARYGLYLGNRTVMRSRCSERV